MGPGASSADIYGVRTPEISTADTSLSAPSKTAHRPIARPASLAESLSGMLDAPVGWHTDDQVGDQWHDNELASYQGDAWVPPAITAPALIASPIAPPGPTRSTFRPKLIGLAGGVAVLALLAVATPRLMGADSGFTGSPAVTTPLLDSSAAVAVPENSADGALALAVGANRRSRMKSFGTETDFGRTRPAPPSTLDYVLFMTPESVRVVAPEMLNGVTHTHLTAQTDALVLAERWPKTDAAQAEITQAIDGKFPLDLWLDPAGNLAKVIIHTTNDGSGSQIEVVY